MTTLNGCTYFEAAANTGLFKPKKYHIDSILNQGKFAATLNTTILCLTDFHPSEFSMLICLIIFSKDFWTFLKDWQNPANFFFRITIYIQKSFIFSHKKRERLNHL